MSLVLDEISDHYSASRTAGVVFMLLVGLFTIVDIVEDWTDGSPLPHIITEICIVTSAGCGAFFLWKSSVKRLTLSNQSLLVQLTKAKEDLTRFHNENRDLASGFIKALQKQLELWNLTPAESEVALLLLKGKSLKEIATERGTSERTVRLQAAGVYAKSNLEGRAQLAAFFIESML